MCGITEMKVHGDTSVHMPLVDISGHFIVIMTIFYKHFFEYIVFLLLLSEMGTSIK
jgi:hypothetical protein